MPYTALPSLLFKHASPASAVGSKWREAILVGREWEVPFRIFNKDSLMGLSYNQHSIAQISREADVLISRKKKKTDYAKISSIWLKFLCCFVSAANELNWVLFSPVLKWKRKPSGPVGIWNLEARLEVDHLDLTKEHPWTKFFPFLLFEDFLTITSWNREINRVETVMDVIGPHLETPKSLGPASRPWLSPLLQANWWHCDFRDSIALR